MIGRRRGAFPFGGWEGLFSGANLLLVRGNVLLLSMVVSGSPKKVGSVAFFTPQVRQGL